MRRQFTATAIRSRLSSDRRQIILEIDGAEPGVSVAFNTEVMKRLITTVTWLQETQVQDGADAFAPASNVVAFPVRA